MSQIKYVFWDSDNTLIETAALHWAKTVNVLQSHGIMLDEKYRRRVHENNGSQNWEWITRELGLMIPKEQYLGEVDEWYAANTDKFRLRDGVREAMEIFADAGCKQCVVTNGRRASVEISHKAASLTGKFAFLLCKEDYEGRKPDPAPYLAALKKMSGIEGHEISPNECLAIEDDPLGVEAAKRAGMTTVFRPTDLVEQTSGFSDYTITNTENFINIITSLTRPTSSSSSPTCYI